MAKAEMEIIEHCLYEDMMGYATLVKDDMLHVCEEIRGLLHSKLCFI